MKTVVLCGGKGLRYDSNIPKALAMIGDKPVIEYIMEIYYKQGYKDFIFALGYKKDYIIEYFNNKKTDFNIEYIDTGEYSNTGHRIKLIEEYIPKDDHSFMCTYADGICNINLELLLKQHIKLNAICTITVVRPYNQYGIVKTSFDGRVTQFIEKPKMKEYINGGFFVMRRDIFSHITKNNEDLEKDILPRLCYEGKLGAYYHENFWETINTTKDEQRLNEIYEEHKEELPWMQILYT